MRRLSCLFSRWLVSQATLLLLISGCDDAKTPYVQGWEGVCVDQDGDGRGFQCEDGPDCNDADRDVNGKCPACARPDQGCACEEGEEPVACELPLSVTPSHGLLCREGRRFCRAGGWSACEGISSFEAPAHLAVKYQSLVNQDAAHLGCSPCHPDCYRVDDPLTAVPDSSVVLVPSGGITLKSTVAGDAGVADAALLDDKVCTPGVAPDTDCDGIPDAYDAYPSAPPFASDHKTIFMGLAPGQTQAQSFKINFALNTADIYFFLDMTASMEDERDNLIDSLLIGNFLPNTGIGIECADTDFDGLPNISLTSGGIAANIACLIRDVRIGAGWFRDIPFTGPYANGIKVAPTDLEMFEHRQDPTSDIIAVAAALLSFKTAGNHNAPEGSMQGLYALVSGAEQYAGWDRPGIPKRTGCPPNTWGYPCFRNGAVPIIIHITDAPMQNGPSPTTSYRQNFLSDTDGEGNCTKNQCQCLIPPLCLPIIGCTCLLPYCACKDADRHPLHYDSSVLSGLRAGTEATYKPLTTSAETFATAQPVGTIDNVLLTYTGSTEKMISDYTYASAGACPNGSTAWNSYSQGAKDAVFAFTVAGNKTLTIASRGSHFDSSIMIKRVGDTAALACNDDSLPGDDAEITRAFTPGNYYAIVKGETTLDNGWLQVTLGDKAKQTTGSFAAKRWLGPNDAGPGGVRDALVARGVKVITVNSSLDPYLAEQSNELAHATGATDLLGLPLTLQIGSNGIGLGLAVLNAVTLLSKQLAMDVGVVLKEEPDDPSPDFGFTVLAVDKLGDGCSAPVDRDNDPAHLPDTHTNCLPGARPEFRVSFTNRAAPNNVPPNPSDSKGGYNMKLQLIGNGAYVVDQIPVYVIPSAVAGSPGVAQYPTSGTYEQDITASGCEGTTAPLWRNLSWNAAIPADTAVRFQLCAGNTDAELASCAPSTVGVLTSGAACTTSATCPNGYCDASGVCHYVKGLSCSTDADCGTAGVCAASTCAWTRSQIDLKPAFGPSNPQGKRKARVRIVLDASADKTRAPTVYNWRLDYDCTPML